MKTINAQLEISTVLSTSNLGTTKSQMLRDSFVKFFEEINEYEKSAKEISVTEETDKVGMKNARELRIKIAKVRTSAESTRKELKEQSLREGKAIDGIANVVKALTVPIEDYLEKQECFAEYAEYARQVEILESRVLQMADYVVDPKAYNLDKMTQEAFEELLASSKMAFNTRKEAEERAVQEKERLAEEERLENERIKIENASLREQAIARNKEIEKERAEEKEEQQKILVAERELAELNAQKKQEEQQRIKDAEKEARIDKIVDQVIECGNNRELIKLIILDFIK